MKIRIFEDLSGLTKEYVAQKILVLAKKEGKQLTVHCAEKVAARVRRSVPPFEVYFASGGGVKILELQEVSEDGARLDES